MITSSLTENVSLLQQHLPINESYDYMTRNIAIAGIEGYLVGINGLCDTDCLQQIISDLQISLFSSQSCTTPIPDFFASRLGFLGLSFSNDWKKILQSILSGPCVLFLEGFAYGIILDTRQYPTRSMEEPALEKVTGGAKDGFVETLSTNCALVRRRIRSPKLVFARQTIGTESQTDVVISYIKEAVDPDLLNLLQEKLQKLQVTSLTLGIHSLKELLLKKSIFHPLPSFLTTGRPDVACSYLLEGHILLFVDGSPTSLVLPCSIFQFCQSPEDYYKPLPVGNFIRVLRYLCVFLSQFLMPFFLLVSIYPHLLPFPLTEPTLPLASFIYVLFVEFGLAIFQYASSRAANDFSGAFAVVGGLLVGDMAVSLQWTSEAVLFYGGATLLCTLGLPSLELGDAIRLYRIFLILMIGFFHGPGFFLGIFCILLSIATTPTFGKGSYFWPLFPFHWPALKTLLFRYPTFKAQPSKIWKNR